MKLTPILILITLTLTFAQDSSSLFYTLRYYQASDIGCENEDWNLPVAVGGCTSSNTPSTGDISAGVESWDNGYLVTVYDGEDCQFVRFTVAVDSLVEECEPAPIGITSALWGRISLEEGANLCFSGDSEVNLEGGSTALMKDVKIGDIVETQHGFSPVYAFIDLKRDQNTLFQSFSYFDQNNELKNLKITEEHLMLAKSPSMIRPEYVLAADVKEGDFIYHKSGSNISMAIVMKKETVLQKGAYAPATLDGTLVVDGVVVSNYGIIDHYFAHAALFPLRAMHYLAPAFIPHQADGFQLYAKILLNTYESLFWHPINWFMGTPSLN